MIESNFKRFSDKELIDYVQGLHQMINQIGSYSMKDYFNCQNGMAELVNRGYLVSEVTILEINKEEEDD